MSNPDRLTAIKAREAKATKGPWCVEADHFNGDVRAGICASIWSPSAELHVAETWSDFEHEPDDAPDEGQPEGTGKANADFIAHAREDLPWAVSRLEQLQGEFDLALLQMKEDSERIATRDEVLKQERVRLEQLQQDVQRFLNLVVDNHVDHLEMFQLLQAALDRSKE